jgi:Na+/H+ antiporter NhaD/arsenite permease-like protein
MHIALFLSFLAGYLLIAFEHQVKLHKSGVALLMAALCWTLYSFVQEDRAEANSRLSENLADTGQIVIFLLGAMIIVELVNAYRGFDMITALIRTRKALHLLWLVSGITFFMSAALDNLTTSIVMVSLTRKLIADPKLRLWFAGAIIVAANAGGAWSPIGDVTTTMLWIDKKITPWAIIQQGFLPSLLSMLLPLTWMSRLPEMRTELPPAPNGRGKVPNGSRRLLLMGLGSLLMVPIYKELTHLPPYMGILLGLGIVWLAADWLHHRGNGSSPQAMQALARIDASSILFFLGILSAVGALEAAGMLETLGHGLAATFSNEPLIVIAIGVVSAVVDNVPLVAGAMGMYEGLHPTDHPFWIFLAYCAGTGGSMLIIGSAAGVAVMGMENISFGWYLRRMSLPVLAGYLAGALLFIWLMGYR